MRSFLAASLTRFFCAAVCWVLFALQSAAFDPTKPLTEYTHTVWTHKDGLPSAFIYSIAQTRDSYLWLATTDGLVRFDGVRFVHWRPKTGHTELLGAVRSLCAARDGSLWIGTAAGLVGHIRGDNLTTYSIGAKIEAMLEDRDGTLWVTTENSLLRFHPATQEQIGTAIALPGPFLSGPLQDKSSSIWFTTDSGILRLDPRDPQVRLVRIVKGKFWLSEDTSGTIWITNPNGFSQPLKDGPALSGNGMTTKKAFNVHTVLRDSEGNTWIGTLGQGLVRLRVEPDGVQKMETFAERDGLSTEFVWCLLEDREHNVWVGTQNGLNRFRDEKVVTLTRREGLASDNVDALAGAPNGTVWASSSIGVNRIDGAHRDLYLKGATVMGLSADRENTLWAGTNRGVVRVENGNWRYLSIPGGIQLQNVTVIAEDHENGVWLCDARKGLYRWADGRITDFSNEPLLKGKSILAAHADGRGKVWFGLNEGGVVVFDGSRFHAHSESDGLAGGSANAVHIDDNTVWIGTEHGLSRFDGQRFVTWKIANGLPGERVLWILSDNQGRIWLGYSTGVACVSVSELDRARKDPLHRVTYSFLDDGDGLKGNPDRGWQSPATRASDGKFWFKTSEGVAIIDPRDLTRNLVVPPVYIERMVADRAVVDATQPVRLRARTRDIEFDYTALSLAEPRKVLFRYKLEGFDSDWRDAGTRRQAFYTNLRPRVYRFRVLASNNDGVWNESGTTLDFDLLPAFYQTQWFLLLCALVLVILAWGAYRLRVWQMTTQLRERFEERLKERTRIAQELHDSLIQDVMAISLQIEVADELLPAVLPAKQSLARALVLCKSALDAGRRALNDLRSAPLSAADLVKSFSQSASELARDHRTIVEVIVEGGERSLNTTMGNDVLQIGRQAISNALQHAHARKIQVLFSYGEQQLQVRVQDDGRGISGEALNLGRSGHYGIAGMKERAERLGGSISIRSRVGEGTEVNLCVPAHLLYRDAEPRSVSRFLDAWHYLTGKLGMRMKNSAEQPPGKLSGSDSETAKPGQTNP